MFKLPTIILLLIGATFAQQNYLPTSMAKNENDNANQNVNGNTMGTAVGGMGGMGGMGGYPTYSNTPGGIPLNIPPAMGSSPMGSSPMGSSPIGSSPIFPDDSNNKWGFSGSNQYNWLPGPGKMRNCIPF